MQYAIRPGTPLVGLVLTKESKEYVARVAATTKEAPTKLEAKKLPMALMDGQLPPLGALTAGMAIE